MTSRMNKIIARYSDDRIPSILNENQMRWIRSRIVRRMHDDLRMSFKDIALLLGISRAWAHVLYLGGNYYHQRSASRKTAPLEQYVNTPFTPATKEEAIKLHKTLGALLGDNT